MNKVIINHVGYDESLYPELAIRDYRLNYPFNCEFIRTPIWNISFDTKPRSTSRDKKYYLVNKLLYKDIMKVRNTENLRIRL